MLNTSVISPENKKERFLRTHLKNAFEDLSPDDRVVKTAMIGLGILNLLLFTLLARCSKTGKKIRKKSKATPFSSSQGHATVSFV